MDAASIIIPLIAAAGALGGAFLGNYSSNRREREKRRDDYINRQLTEFYGPLLGLRATIAAHSEFRVKLEGAQDSSWRELVAQARQSDGVSAITRFREGPLGQKYEGMIDYENQKFREMLFPLYQKMAETFRDNISLAEPDTREHFPTLVEYVDVWDRFLQGKLPGQVSQALGHTEANLHPFYDNIRETHDRLRAQLASPKRH